MNNDTHVSPPFFSVIMPVYNGMPYLPEAVESILKQSYSNFEFLILNDGSTDQSEEYLKTLKDPRLKIIHRPRKGVTCSLNELLRAAKAEWIVRMDSDDKSCPQRLERTHQAIQGDPHLKVLFGRAQYMHRIPLLRFLFKATEGTHSDFQKIIQRGYLVSACHPASAYHKRSVIDLGGYQVESPVEDIDLWWRLIIHNAKTSFLPYTLLHYRMHSKSISSLETAEQELKLLYVQYRLLSHLNKSALKSFEEMASSLKKIQIIPSTGRLIQRSFFMSLEQGAYLKAVAFLIRLLVFSFPKVSERFLYTLGFNRKVKIGVSPEFYRKQNLLNPAAHNSEMPAQQTDAAPQQAPS